MKRAGRTGAKPQKAGIEADGPRETRPIRPALPRSGPNPARTTPRNEKPDGGHPGDDFAGVTPRTREALARLRVIERVADLAPGSLLEMLTADWLAQHVEEPGALAAALAEAYTIKSPDWTERRAALDCIAAQWAVRDGKDGGS